MPRPAVLRPSPAPAEEGQSKRPGERPASSRTQGTGICWGRAGAGVLGARGGPPAGRPVPGMSAGAKKSPRGGAAAGPAHSWMHFKSTFRNTPARAGA